MKLTIGLWLGLIVMIALLTRDAHQFFKFFGVIAIMAAMVLTPFAVGKLMLMLDKKTGFVRSLLSVAWMAVLVVAGVLLVATMLGGGGGGIEDISNTRP